MLVSVLNSREESQDVISRCPHQPHGYLPWTDVTVEGWVWLPRRAGKELVDWSPCVSHLTKAVLVWVSVETVSTLAVPVSKNYVST